MSDIKRIYETVVANLKMIEMKCDHKPCGYQGGVSVEKQYTGKPRSCPVCRIGICHEVKEETIGE